MRKKQRTRRSLKPLRSKLASGIRERVGLGSSGCGYFTGRELSIINAALHIAKERNPQHEQF